jgi:hypothetical protein
MEPKFLMVNPIPINLLQFLGFCLFYLDPLLRLTDH